MNPNAAGYTERITGLETLVSRLESERSNMLQQICEYQQRILVLTALLPPVPHHDYVAELVARASS